MKNDSKKMRKTGPRQESKSTTQPPSTTQQNNVYIKIYSPSNQQETRSTKPPSSSMPPPVIIPEYSAPPSNQIVSETVSESGTQQYPGYSAPGAIIASESVNSKISETESQQRKLSSGQAPVVLSKSVQSTVSATENQQYKLSSAAASGVVSGVGSLSNPSIISRPPSTSAPIEIISKTKHKHEDVYVYKKRTTPDPSSTKMADMLPSKIEMQTSLSIPKRPKTRDDKIRLTSYLRRKKHRKNSLSEKSLKTSRPQQLSFSNDLPKDSVYVGSSRTFSSAGSDIVPGQSFSLSAVQPDSGLPEGRRGSNMAQTLSPVTQGIVWMQ